MNLKDFLSKKGKAPKGKNINWLPFCKLNVTTGSLWVGDPLLANDSDGYLAKVSPGHYVVEGIGLASGRARIISRLRVRLESAKNPKLGKELGDTGTDSAMIGVCDIKAFDKACGPNSGEEVQEAIEAQTRDDFGIINFKKFPGAVMPFIPIGSDGSGSVFALMSSGKRVGIELSFLGEDEAEDGEESIQVPKLESLSRSTAHFISRRMPDGGKVSFWIGGEFKAGIEFCLWSSASRGPVDYRIRVALGSVLKNWTAMKKQNGGGAKFGAREKLKSGKFEFDFRIGETVYSAVKLTLR
jgi:hypothetical protein